MLKKFLIFKTGMLAVKAGLGIFLILFSMWQQSIAYAQALPATPVANFVVNRAVGGIITRVAAARGFAANDPRILTTMNAAGAQLSVVNTAATVAGVGFAVAGAPVWLGIAASLGVLAVGAAIVAGNTTISMDAGKLTVQSPPPVLPPYVPPSSSLSTPKWAAALAAGYTLYKSSSCPSTNECWLLPAVPAGDGYQWTSGNVTVKNTDAAQFGRAVAILSRPSLNEAYLTSQGVTYIWDYHDILVGSDFAGLPTYTLRIREARLGCALPLCDPEYGLPNYDRVNNAATLSNPGAMGRVSAADLQTVYPSIPADSAQQLVSPDTLARIVDQAWKNAAAQPGYEGLPYTAVNPVTAAEVQPWTAANPEAVPKIADLLTPASNPNTQAVPISPTVTVGTSPTPTPTPTPTGTLTDVNVVNTPNVNVTNQISVDLGPNPNTAAPGVPTPPTAQVIFQPFLDLVAPLINYQPPALAGECPRPVFNILGNEITMSSHCDIAENNRGAIQSIMLVVFLIGAVTIVFSA